MQNASGKWVVEQKFAATKTGRDTCWIESVAAVWLRWLVPERSL